MSKVIHSGTKVGLFTLQWNVRPPTSAYQTRKWQTGPGIATEDLHRKIDDAKQGGETALEAAPVEFNKLMSGTP